MIQECLRRRRKIIKNKGIKSLSESRGRKKVSKLKTGKMSEVGRLKYLEVEVKHLRAENVFLTKLQTKRTE